MEKITAIGLDIAKHVFQVHGIDDAGAVAVRRTLRRDALSVGLPGRLKSSVTPRIKAHRSTSLLTNSGP